MAGAGAPESVYIQEYRVQGAHRLSRIEVEEAVYPFLGPGCTKEDVEQARAALEKAYHDKGYQTVAVQIPPQQVRGGIVVLQVTEGAVERLRVRGARYFSPEQIKREAPSLAEGTVPNFNEVNRDVIALNQLADRRITPSLRAGSEPGAVDIDLDVKDSLPLHGSVELNNRYSANTTALRLNGSVSYNNLWQLGHAAGFNFQVAPERSADAKAFSGYYLARFAGNSGLSLMLQGTKQDSSIATLAGGPAMVGRGQTLGASALLALPSGKAFYHSVSLGLNYKHFDPSISSGGITYSPLSASYEATWLGATATTDFNGSVNLHLRGMGDDPAGFNARRTGADGSFLYFRGDLSHTRNLPAGFEIFGKVQGQIADQPLVDGEQFSAGGLDTVRGYLESEQVGDNAICGTLELRSPSLKGWAETRVNEWHVYVFGDAGQVTVIDPTAESTSRFNLASVGVGSRIRLLDHCNGSLDAGLPLIGQPRTPSGTQTKAHDLRLTFRAVVDY